MKNRDLIIHQLFFKLKYFFIVVVVVDALKGNYRGKREREITNFELEKFCSLVKS